MTTPAQPNSEQQVQDALAAAANGQQQQQTDPTPPNTEQQQPPVTQESQGLYEPYLAELPEAVRPLAEATFKKWDADVTRRFQELHSQYDPWKPVLDYGDPDAVQQSLVVAQALENDPERFIKALADAYPDLVQQALGQTLQTQTPTGGAGEQGLGDLDPDDPIAKRLAALEQMVQQAVGGVNSFTEQQQMAENQRILDETLTKLHETHGDFDDTFVLSQMAYRGLKPEQAIQEFKNTIGKYTTPQPAPTVTSPAPVVMPPGGGTPATPIDPGALDDKATQALVAGILDAANQQQ